MRKANQSGRSKGCTFVMLTHCMMDSAAWRGLSHYAQALWLHIVRRYNGHNNGDIPLSCREAKLLLNCSKDKAGEVFQELIEAGFIKIGQDSSFNYKQKKARRWILTHQPFNDLPPTNEWREKSKTQSV